MWEIYTYVYSVGHDFEEILHISDVYRYIAMCMTATVQNTHGIALNASARSNPSAIDNDMVSVKINECVVLEFVLNGCAKY